MVCHYLPSPYFRIYSADQEFATISEVIYSGLCVGSDSLPHKPKSSQYKVARE